MMAIRSRTGANRIRHPFIGFDEPHRIGAEEIDPGCSFRDLIKGKTFKEGGDRYFQEARNVVDLRCADPVRAALVFLNLLKGQTQRIA